MIHAYDKLYLEKVRTNMGRMFDFAVHEMKYDLEEFYEMLLSSRILKRFERGEATLFVGKSGVELVYEILWERQEEKEIIKPMYTSNRSPEYWVGWALAYYQWNMNLNFSDIADHVSISEVLSLYSPYHEMDIRQFVDKMNELYERENKDTKLKIARMRVGLSQRQLADRSGVPLRTIQQYEQRRKSINRAQVMYLLMLSKALFCDLEDLLEPTDFR